MKTEKIPKEKEDISQVKNSKNKITNKHLINLDNFIQQCLDKFKFIDPKQEFYDATGNEKDLIISHKSTIPDLVIWNKKFNKNECFEEGNTQKNNWFHRFQFYLRIKSNKPDKDKKKDKKNEKEKEKTKKNKENKEGKKNKKNKDKENKNNTNNNNPNNNNINNNNANINNANNIINNNNNNNFNNNNNNNNVKSNISENSTNFSSKSEKKILDLSELDINKIKEYNPRHKNNFFSSNKEIMNLNDNNFLINDNKDKSKALKEIGINREIPSNEKNQFNTLQQKDYFNIKNKIGQNNNYNQIFYSNESQGSRDINITINNNNYIQQYQLNNNNNINRFININKNNDLNFKDNNNINFPLENIYLDNKLKENQILNLININSNLKNWLVIEKDSGNVIGIFNSIELYLYLSKNTSSLINYSIREKSSQFILSGDKMFKILLQYYDYNINNNLFQYNQLEKIRQQMKQNNLRNKQNINKRNINQMNINMNNNFNDNPLNKNINIFDFNLNDNNIKANSNLDYTDNVNHLNYLMRNFNLLDYNKLNNNNINNNLSLENNNNKNIFNNISNNGIINPNINPNINNINLNTNKYNNKENDLFNPDNFFNPKGMSIFIQNQNKDQNTNNLSIEEKNLETFNNSNNNNNSLNNVSNNYFSYFTMNDNNQKEKEKEKEIENEKNIIEIEDKIDNEDYNFENFIFNSHNKNSNSKSNKDNVEDININDAGQFEPNNDYQNDNYNSIFS